MTRRNDESGGLTARPLPEAVELHLGDVIAEATLLGRGKPHTLPQCIASLRAAIAAAMAPGEPVAWGVVDRNRTFVELHYHRHRDRADSAVGACDVAVPTHAPFAVVPLYAAPAEAAPVADHPQGGPEPEGRESVRDDVERARQEIADLAVEMVKRPAPNATPEGRLAQERMDDLLGKFYEATVRYIDAVSLAAAKGGSDAR